MMAKEVASRHFKIKENFKPITRSTKLVLTMKKTRSVDVNRMKNRILERVKNDFHEQLKWLYEKNDALTEMLRAVRFSQEADVPSLEYIPTFDVFVKYM